MNNSSFEFPVTYAKTREITDELDIEINFPSKAVRQIQRISETAKDFFRRLIFIPLWIQTYLL